MTIIGKPVASGTLTTTSLTTLYTVPASTRAYIKGAYFVVDRDAGQTVTLTFYKNIGSADIPLFDFDLDPGDSVNWDVPTNLDAADLLKAQASIANVVTYDISAGEEAV